MQNIERYPCLELENESFNNSIVANHMLTNKNLFDKCYTLDTLPKKNIFITIDFDIDENLRLTNPDITQYDLAVMDSVYTLLTHNIIEFTPEMLSRVMSGNINQDVTSHKIKTIEKSLKKLSLIKIDIDCSKEYQARNKIDKTDTAILSSYLLPLNKIKIYAATKNVKMIGYKVIEKPAFYKYAETVGQILTVPISILNTSQRLSDTEEVIIIKRALIKRIEVMKNKKNKMNSNVISYEWYDTKKREYKGFLNYLGFYKENYSNWRKKKSNIHNAIVKILEEFTKDNYIAGFEVLQKKSKINGIKILLQEPKNGNRGTE